MIGLGDGVDLWCPNSRRKFSCGLRCQTRTPSSVIVVTMSST